MSTASINATEGQRHTTMYGRGFFAPTVNHRPGVLATSPSNSVFKTRLFKTAVYSTIASYLLLPAPISIAARVVVIAKSTIFISLLSQLYYKVVCGHSSRPEENGRVDSGSPQRTGVHIFVGTPHIEEYRRPATVSGDSTRFAGVARTATGSSHRQAGQVNSDQRGSSAARVVAADSTRFGGSTGAATGSSHRQAGQVNSDQRGSSAARVVAADSTRFGGSTGAATGSCHRQAGQADSGHRSSSTARVVAGAADAAGSARFERAATADYLGSSRPTNNGATRSSHHPQSGQANRSYHSTRFGGSTGAATGSCHRQAGQADSGHRSSSTARVVAGAADAAGSARFGGFPGAAPGYLAAAAPVGFARGVGDPLAVGPPGFDSRGARRRAPRCVGPRRED